MSEARRLVFSLKFLMLASLVMVLAVMAGTVSAAGTFFDDFEGDLSAWVGKPGPFPSAQIVPDPIRSGNNVVKFNIKTGAGDMYGPSLSVTPGDAYTLTFEYLGTSVVAGGYAGYAQTPGGAHVWLAGTGSFPTPLPLTNDGQ